MPKRHNILSTTTSFFISSAGKIANVQEIKMKLFEYFFIVDNSHVKTVWLNLAVLTKHDIFYFWGNANFLKYYPVKVTQNCFDAFNGSNQIANFEIICCSR